MPLIWQDDFESATGATSQVGVTRIAAEHADTANGTQVGLDYGLRTTSTGSDGALGYLAAFTGFTGAIWRAEDLDGTGLANFADGTDVITWSGIDITGQSNLEFSGTFAALNDIGGQFYRFEREDFIRVEVRIDGGAWTQLVSFHGNEALGTGGNLAVDTNGDGLGDGVFLTTAARDWTVAIGGTGSALDLRVTYATDGANEELAFDDMEIFSAAAPNAPPTVSLTNPVTSIAENTDTSARIKVADIVVTDDGNGQNDLSLSGTEARFFEISGNVLYLRAGTNLDFEARVNDFDVTVEVNDLSLGAGADDTATLNVAVTDVTETPAATVVWRDDFTSTDGSTSQAGVTRVAGEHATPAIGTFDEVGDYAFITNSALIDATIGSTFDFSGFDGRFWRVEDLNAIPDPDFADGVDVISWSGIDITGKTGLTFEGLFAAPGSTDPGDGIGGGFRFSSSDYILVEAQIDGGGYAKVLQIEGTEAFGAGSDGELAVDTDFNGVGDGTILTALVQELSGSIAGTGSTLDLRVTYSLNTNNDEIGFDNFTISAPLNQPPSIGGDLAIAVNEGGRVQLTTADLTETDPDDSGAGLTYTVTANPSGLFETDDGVNVFRVTQFTQAQLEAGHVYYTHLGAEETATSFNVSLADGGEDGATPAAATVTIAVTPVNDAPTISLGTDSLSYTENGGPLTLFPTTSIAEPEGDQIESARVYISDPVEGDVLALGAGASGAFTAAFDPDTYTLTLTGPGSAADLTQDLRLVTYQSTSENPTVGDTDLTGTIGVSVTDDGTPPATNTRDGKTSIQITAENDAPSVEFVNSIVLLPEDTDTTTRILVGRVEILDDGLGTNTPFLFPDFSTDFELDGLEVFLRADTVLDFETAQELTFSLGVDDPTLGVSFEDSIGGVLGIDDVNEAPELDVSNIVIALAEDADTSTRIRIADLDVTDDALGGYVLALDGADAGLFEIESETLYLSAGVTLDHETQSHLDVNVTIDDATIGLSPDDREALSVQILDVNEAPTVALENVVAGVAEDTDTSTRVKVADISITDDGPGTNVLALGGRDAGLFEIVGSELFLAAGAALDHETAGTLNVSVTVDDTGVGSTPDDTASLVLPVTDVNEAPSLTLENVVATLAEDTDTSVRERIADVVINDDVPGINALSLAGANAGLFEIDAGTLYLSVGTALDFETLNTLDVAVLVDDPGVGLSPDDRVALSVAIGDVNEAPDIALSNVVADLDEDTDTSARVKIADLTIIDDDLGTNDVTLSGDDADLFEVVGSELFLAAGAALDFESEAQLTVTVDLDDADLGGTPDAQAPLVITINDINEAPDISLSGVLAAIEENSDTTARIKVADITVTDDALGGYTLGLTGSDAALFEIEGSQLFLAAGVSLDFEAMSQLDVTVTVDDPALGIGPDDSAALSLGITDVNEAPALAVVDPLTSLREDTDTGARIKVADLAITDDEPGTNILSLSGADAALFEIVGEELFLKAGTMLDFEDRAALALAVDLDDADVGDTPDASVALTLAIEDVNEAPGIALENVLGGIAEDADTSTRTKVADIVVTDDAPGTNDLTLSGDDASLFEIDAGALYLVAGAVLDFEADGSLDVVVGVDDATIGTGPEDNVSLALPVTDVNEAPGLTLLNVLETLAEDADTSAPIAIATLVVSDDAQGSIDLTLAGDDAALFRIEGDQLVLVAGAILDFDSDASLDVAIVLDDPTLGDAAEVSLPLTIAITEASEPTNTNGSQNDDTLVGGAGGDAIAGQAGDDLIDGQGGPDSIAAGSGDDTVSGGEGDDAIGGGEGEDSLSGDAGDDTIGGGQGNDMAEGGSGDDSVVGGQGSDTLDGGDGADTLGGGNGADSLTGGAGEDVIDGGAGDDTLKGGEGADVMSGAQGDDTLLGGQGNDALGGGAGADSLNGGLGDDSLGGGLGNDTLNGGAGDDLLAGGGRDDLLNGGLGQDTLIGGDGDDTMTGGAGADTFVFSDFKPGSADVITDFIIGEDMLRMHGVENAPGSGLAGKLAALDITDTDAGAMIDYGNQTVLLMNVSADDLTLDAFVFV